MPAEWSLRAVRVPQLESYPTLRGLIGQLRSCAMCLMLWQRKDISYSQSHHNQIHWERASEKGKNIRKMNTWHILTPTCFWCCVEKCLRVWVFGLYTYNWFPITSLSTCVSWTSYLPLRTLIFPSIDNFSYSVIVVKKWDECKALNIIHSYRISVLLLLLEA